MADQRAQADIMGGDSAWPKATAFFVFYLPEVKCSQLSELNPREYMYAVLVGNPFILIKLM